VLLLDLSFKQYIRNSKKGASFGLNERIGLKSSFDGESSGLPIACHRIVTTDGPSGNDQPAKHTLERSIQPPGTSRLSPAAEARRTKYQGVWMISIIEMSNPCAFFIRFLSAVVRLRLRACVIGWVLLTETCAGLGALGIIAIDPERNNVSGAVVISAANAKVTVRVIPPAENLMIVNHVVRLMGVDQATFRRLHKREMAITA
jgi:hypothetical protein